MAFERFRLEHVTLYERDAVRHAGFFRELTRELNHLRVYSTPRARAPRVAAAICALLTLLERELVGEHYDSYFARARTVWACT